MAKPTVVAIDGPAASGKGSLARALASHFGFDYLDTGAIYRRVALKVSENKIGLNDIKSIISTAKNLDLTEKYDDSVLRSDNIGTIASIISPIPAVRDVLTDYQRNFAKNSIKGAILDGRDIGTVICPNADVKLFVTANIEIRAERRHKELQSRKIPSTYASVLAEMQERDDRDSDRINAHKNFEQNNIHYIDTSDKTPQSVLDAAIEIVQSQIS